MKRNGEEIERRIPFSQNAAKDRGSAVLSRHTASLARSRATT